MSASQWRRAMNSAATAAVPASTASMPRVARAPGASVPTDTAPKPVAPRPVASGRMVELQIGAFADRGNAEKAARAAQAAGPTRIQSVVVGGVTFHRVIVGPAAEGDLRAALQRLGFREARPVRRP